MDNDKQSINASPGLIALRSLRLPLLLAAIAIVGLTAAAITYDIARHRTEQTIRLQAIADLKAGQIDDWLRERQGGANYLHTDLTLTENYRRWRQHGDRTSREHLLDHVVSHDPLPRELVARVNVPGCQLLLTTAFPFCR